MLLKYLWEVYCEIQMAGTIFGSRLKELYLDRGGRHYYSLRGTTALTGASRR
jgi:hypothetical protein